jgi:hypothetical protein
MLIPGDLLKAKDGKLLLQITEELWETIYLDQAELIAVDHPENTRILVNEKFSPPPYPEHRIYHIPEKILPVAATDDRGHDQLDALREKDDVYATGFRKSRYQGITEMHELVIDPGDVPTTENLCLFLNGWIFPTDASINKAIAQSEQTRVTAPYIQVLDEGGNWVTVIENLGFPAGKDKTIIADIGKEYLSDDRKVRIVTNMEIYWDQAFFGCDDAGIPMEYSRIRPETADHHYRGFSRMYRKNGRYGPHWFDYSTVTQQPLWRDLQGYYTRFGEVSGLLMEDDDRYIIANAGEETSLVFDEGALPQLPPGWTRDYIIHTVGWVKDGDMNTAEGNTVEALPFHGMTRYPYGPEESYPGDRAHRRYLKKYNTRYVNNRPFRQALRMEKTSE